MGALCFVSGILLLHAAGRGGIPMVWHSLFGCGRTQAKGLSVDLVSKHVSDFTDLNRCESDSSQRAFSRSRVQARVRLHGSQQVRVGLKPKGFQSISCPSTCQTSRISTGACRTQAKGLSVDLVSKHVSDFMDLDRCE